MKKYLVLVTAAAGILVALPAQAGDAKAGGKVFRNAKHVIMLTKKRTKVDRTSSILLAAPLAALTVSNTPRQ